MVQGSGSGAAGESSGCAVQPWGFAEVVMDGNGTYVIVNRLGQTGDAAYLVAFLASESSAVSSSVHGEEERETYEFVAVP